jgi:hypothetical protein
MPFAMALDALDASIQPGAVTLLAGYRYFFIHRRMPLFSDIDSRFGDCEVA